MQGNPCLTFPQSRSRFIEVKAVGAYLFVGQNITRIANYEMKQSSKERLATLMMDELLERLSERESIRKMLGEMTSLPIDEVIEHLLVEFEQAVEQYHQKHLHALHQTPKTLAYQTSDQLPVEEGLLEDHFSPSVPDELPVTDTPASLPEQPEEKSIVEVVSKNSTKEIDLEDRIPASTPEERAVTDKPEPVQNVKETVLPFVQLDPIKLEFPKISLRVDLPERTPPGKPLTTDAPPEEDQILEENIEPSPAPESAGEAEDLHKLEELARKIEAEYAVRMPAAPPPEPEPARSIDVDVIEPATAPETESAEIAEATPLDEEEDEIISVEPVGSGKHMAHARYAFADNEYVYVHAVSKIPDGEEPSPEAFMLEEKGIDGHGFAFALDYEGMRFYLSRINPNEMSISRSMVLLLNKQESIQLQGIHESTLNDLRGHGILLPLEFGTVSRGKDQLLGMIDRNRDDLEEALDDIAETTRWTVTASVLDSTIARIVGTDVQKVGRDRARDRASYTSAVQTKKFDIKVLERILQREKKLAEAVHAELSNVSQDSAMETIVGLGSGSSEDWKVILKASYEVPPREIGKFNRAVTDLQYHHMQYDLMLALTGNRDFLALRRK